MIQALRIAATGMFAQQKNVDVISNNLANTNTTGYKQRNAAFSDLISITSTGVGSVTSAAGTIAPTGTQIGLGVKLGSIYRTNTQGALQNTENTFDLAIQGRGFFQITKPNGETQYTRDGTFQINDTGEIVTKQGYTLDPGITIPQDALDITVAPDGTMTADVNGTITNLGQITIAMFVNDNGLSSEGDNLFAETDASGAPINTVPGQNGSGELLQGFLEGSNVDPVTEITRLITAQRAYELNSRVLSTADEMLSSVNQVT